MEQQHLNDLFIHYKSEQMNIDKFEKRENK